MRLRYCCYLSGGILLYDSGTVAVQSNEVSKNGIGIWDYNDASAPAAVNVLTNNIHDNYGFGLVLGGTDNPPQPRRQGAKATSSRTTRSAYSSPQNLPTPT